MALKVGDRIPDFVLKDQYGEDYDVRNHIGSKKLVLFFYPRDGSLTCTRQACYFRDIHDIFNEIGAEVVGISEQSVDSHFSFSEANNLNYRILSDPNNEVRNLFGVPYKAFGLIPGRVTYVINIKGEVTYIFNSQTKVQRHVDEALKICMVLSKQEATEQA